MGTSMRTASIMLSIFLIFVATSLYISKSPYWFYVAVVGMWLFFDNLSHLRKNKTTLDLLIQKKYKRFIIIFVMLALFGYLIEGVGNWLVDFWDYSFLSTFTIIISILFFYPFIMMSFRETYQFMHSLVKNYTAAVLLSMLAGILIWEVPNVYSQDWVYEIPFASFAIFQIDIIVIIGWVILILGPICIYKLAEKYAKRF